jgi:hypothetical protein
MRGVRHNPDDVKRIIRLYESGRYSLRDVAAMAEPAVNFETVRNWLKRFGVPINKPYLNVKRGAKS